MIERKNWLQVKEYLNFHREALQNDDKTIKRKHTYLRHLIEWADNQPFYLAYNITPSFPTYLLTARNDGKAERLSSNCMRRACSEARQLLSWLKEFHPDQYQDIPKWWIPSIRPSRAHSRKSELPVRDAYKLEDVRKLISLPHSTLIQTRDRAALAFLFLSGMRIDAFVSLPISCVDLKKLTIWQLPKKGVRTKNHKAAITYLLDIPDLLEIVICWDKKVRAELPDCALWYAPVVWSGDSFSGKAKAGLSRACSFAKSLREMCDQAELSYRSPHKLRHGHALYALRRARTFPEFKAISQNLMHDSMTTTDAIYGQLMYDEVRHVITEIGKREYDGDPRPSVAAPTENPELANTLIQLLQVFQQEPDLIREMLANHQ